MFENKRQKFESRTNLRQLKQKKPVESQYTFSRRKKTNTFTIFASIFVREQLNMFHYSEIMLFVAVDLNCQKDNFNPSS